MKLQPSKSTRIFGPKKDTSLMRTIVAVVVAAAALFGAYRLYTWHGGQGSTGATVPVEVSDNLEKARGLLAEGKTEDARVLLEPIAAEVKNDAVTPVALRLLAEIQEKNGNIPAALELLERAQTEFPNSAELPSVALSLARLLENSGQADRAAKIYEQVRADAPPEVRAPAITGLGREAERAGDLVKARDAYRQAVREATFNSPAWNDAVDQLGRLNVQLIFSAQETPESKVYVIEKGDNLTSIGIKLNTTLGLLMRANGIQETTSLQLGDRIKHTPKDFRILIERSTCRLFLLDKDGIFKRYSVGLGKEGNATTLGNYKIGNKEKDPIWHKRGEGAIPPGDPRNELGTRWMPLVPTEEGLPTDLGIHGTIKPETIGSYCSMGCARMHREDVEELYDLVVRSTPVQIVETCSLEQLQ
jgi:lipoprotein-anchoring transpeptidase ErfK/SrfK/predicted negative regulator of RcsB-dependent stress response